MKTGWNPSYLCAYADGKTFEGDSKNFLGGFSTDEAAGSDIEIDTDAWHFNLSPGLYAIQASAPGQTIHLTITGQADTGDGISETANTLARTLYVKAAGAQIAVRVDSGSAPGGGGIDIYKLANLV